MAMRVVVASNAFKGCLSAPKACEAISSGVKAANSLADVVCVPLADGGDGTVEALVEGQSGVMVEVDVMDPLLRPTKSRYGLIHDGRLAVIEMALASGLWMLKKDELNPMKTTTFGTGQLMADALDKGVETLVIGIGGSATTDGGVGMAAALGFKFMDAEGNEVREPTGGDLARIQTIQTADVHPGLKKVEILVACDVVNPLYGESGAAAVYGPQKGGTPEMIKSLDDGLKNLSEVWKRCFKEDVSQLPGAGAAGGLGGGLTVFCGGKMQSGFDLIADFAKLDDALKGADLVITGEGKLDSTTRYGKVPSGVGKRASQQGVPCLAIGGSIEREETIVGDDTGIDSVISLCKGPSTLDFCMDNAYTLLQSSTEQSIRLFEMGRKAKSKL